MSLVVARKQTSAGSGQVSEKTVSPRAIKRGPPVAKKPARDSLSDPQKPGSPRKAESPRMTKKAYERSPRGSPVSPRKSSPKPEVPEPEVLVIQQSPREAAGMWCIIYCYLPWWIRLNQSPWLGSAFDAVLVDLWQILPLIFFYRHVQVISSLSSCFCSYALCLIADTNPKSPHSTNNSRSRVCDWNS